MNVMFVLLIGNIATGIMALSDSSCSFVDWINSLSSGIMGMSELILISMIAGGIFALIAEQGIMERFINLISSKIHSKRGAELSIVLLVGLVNMMTANNTVAILSVGDIAKRIANRYNIVARRMASILDITSCAVQGLLPYGAQLLMASSLAGISALSIMPYLYYPMLIGLMVILTILIPNTLKGKKKAI
jgi:Na+/H+ antiporter NhaC